MNSEHNPKLPPQNLDAEMSILGGILIDNDSLDRVLSIISPDDFYREAHRKVFAAIMRLAEDREPCDLVTLSASLKQAGELDEVGGAAYLLLLVDYVPTAANITYYCKIVKEKSVNRKLITIATAVISQSYEGQATSTELLEQMEVGMSKLVATHKSDPVGAKELVVESVKRLKHRRENRGKLTGIPYGWPEMDAVTNGMHPGDLVIIAGRPSMGKSVLAGNIAENVGEFILENGKLAGCLFFSLEMGRDQLVDRSLASMGRVKFSNIRSGMLEDSEWPRISEATNRLHKSNFAIDDTAGISLHEIKVKARAVKRKSGLNLVIVDYIQLMKTTSKESRALAIGELSRGLKQMAKEMGITVIALSQLNRSVDSRNDKRPTMSDLRDSGEIEQDADVILFPFRPAEYCDKCRDKKNDGDHITAMHQLEAEIIIAKQRNGERNLTIPLVWQGRFQKFEGVATTQNRIDLD